MKKKLLYCVLDCETATLPFADIIAKGDPERKKRIAIARPLIYDIGWTICDRKGHIYDKKNFLISEIFSVPSVFNTAYYADKRPLYLEMMKRGEITVKPWEEVKKIMLADFARVDGVGAFNSMFDFKKAIPFTDLYIQKLYSPDYYDWEKIQRGLCQNIADKHTRRKDEEKDFDPRHFNFHGTLYNLFDLWGLSTSYLLNNASYKKVCLNKKMLTNSGVYFKTSAESTYRYLCDKYDFIEAHTALDDAEIETFILSRIAARHSIEYGIKYFPFRDLGETLDFCQRLKKPNLTECYIVYDAIQAYIDASDPCNYVTMLEHKVDILTAYMSK